MRLYNLTYKASILSKHLWTQCLAVTGVVVCTALLLNLMGLIVLIALPGLFFLCARCFRYPTFSLNLVLVASVFATGLSRYVTAPTGLAVDAILVLGCAVSVYHYNRTRNSVSVWLPLLFGLWMLLTLFQLLNPQMPSTSAWFYAMRGVALYPLLIAIIGFCAKPDQTVLRNFIWLWAGLSILGTMWGLKQLVIGLDPFEQAWLARPDNFSTHMLYGKLRVFSVYSDSGQFGAAQGHMAVVAVILGLGPGTFRSKLIWAAVAVMCLIGLLISGTRGALAVPAVGGLLYLVLCRNWKWIVVGATLMICVFAALKFTYVGHNVYEIRRMRTALVEGTNTASFQVRLENQRRLAAYLDDKPFGGGVGSAGYWGRRFSPGTFLADLALDSWYIKIWAEYGIAGLSIYIAILLILFGSGIRAVHKENDLMHRQVLLALLCGFAGILAASYGNQVFGQMPTGVIVPVCLIYLMKPTKKERT